MKGFSHVSMILSVLILIGLQACTTDNNAEPMNEREAKIDSLVEQMTLDEKIQMIHASSSFTNGGVERLGIPELVMSDGPHGVRHEHGRDWVKDLNVYDSSTYLPVGTALAATWNSDLGYQFGQVLGSEANFRGKDIILGPGVNIIRSPRNGRNFEYMTEDPYLNSQMAVGYVKGVQEWDVAVCVKHYIANTLEVEREYANVEMDERALREIYLPAYKAAVEEGGAHTLMAAYNKFRGVYCAHNSYLLDDILRGEWGFDGAVISDWNAVKNTLGAANAGLDIEMGSELVMPVHDYTKFFLADTLKTLVENGEVDESRIDAKVRNILRLMYKINKFGERKQGEYNTPEHQAVARKIADEAIVLLKNESTLPLDAGKIKKLAVIGANANHKHSGAGGSSQIKAYYEVTALQGLQDLLGDNVEITYAPGYRIARENFATDELKSEAVNAARGADAVVYVGGLFHGYSDEWNDNAYDSEVVDKPDMMLPFEQDDLLEAVLEANPNTTVVLMSGGPVDMRAWEAKAPAIIQMWYAGMEGGNAIADVLFGNVNPSGKLPMTFPAKLEDSPAHSVASYPDESLLIDHKESIFVGYRHFDTRNVEPAYAFGHGLSYTTFEYSDLKLEKTGNGAKVTVTVSNTGDITGSEVVQLYVGDEESLLPRPQKELKGFNKVTLAPGASEAISFELSDDSFKYYNDQKGAWVFEGGTFTFHVGSSSRDIRLEGSLEL